MTQGREAWGLGGHLRTCMALDGQLWVELDCAQLRVDWWRAQQGMDKIPPLNRPPACPGIEPAKSVEPSSMASVILESGASWDKTGG